MFRVNNKSFYLSLSYIFLVNSELFPTYLCFFVVVVGQVLVWWVLIGFQLFSVLRDVKPNLILDFNKSDLELELFLIHSFQEAVRIRVYWPTCLCWSYALCNFLESIGLTVNTWKPKTMEVEKLFQYRLILEFLISLVVKIKRTFYS